MGEAVGTVMEMEIVVVEDVIIVLLEAVIVALHGVEADQKEQLNLDQVVVMMSVCHGSVTQRN